MEAIPPIYHLVSPTSRMGPINNHQQKIRRKKTWRKPQEIDRNLQTWTVPVTIWKYLNRLSATRKGLNVSFYMSTNPCYTLKYQAHIITYQPFFQTLVISCNHFYFIMFLSISCKTHIFEQKRTPPFIQFEFVKSPMTHDSFMLVIRVVSFQQFPTPPTDPLSRLDVVGATSLPWVALGCFCVRRDDRWSKVPADWAIAIASHVTWHRMALKLGIDRIWRLETEG